jgi:hypothetical protein
MSWRSLFINAIIIVAASNPKHEIVSWIQPSSLGLNPKAVGATSGFMRKGTIARFRALILLVAFGIGLAGQAMAFAPMAMAQGEGQTMAASMTGMDGCPDCAGGNSSNNRSKSLAPISCAIAFCSVSVSPAILPQGPAVALSHDGTFILTTAERVRGISIRPDLGPPRLSHNA